MHSATSEYALSAIVHIARIGAGRAVLAREVAALAKVPHNYLSKVLSTLSRAGILQGSRGAGGGYRLARDPSRIFLADIIDLFDGERSRPACLFGGGRECSDETACYAHEDWKKVRSAYLEFIETKTIADISGLSRPGIAGTETPAIGADVPGESAQP